MYKIWVAPYLYELLYRVTPAGQTIKDVIRDTLLTAAASPTVVARAIEIAAEREKVKSGRDSVLRTD